MELLLFKEEYQGVKLNSKLWRSSQGYPELLKWSVFQIKHMNHWALLLEQDVQECLRIEKLIEKSCPCSVPAKPFMKSVSVWIQHLQFLHYLQKVCGKEHFWTRRERLSSPCVQQYWCYFITRKSSSLKYFKNYFPHKIRLISTQFKKLRAI